MINEVKSSETITISLSEYNEFKSLKERCSELETQVNWLMEQLKIRKIMLARGFIKIRKNLPEKTMAFV